MNIQEEVQSLLQDHHNKIDMGYVTGNPGAGKTHSLLGHIKTNLYKSQFTPQKYIIAAPSINLDIQIHNDLIDAGIPNVHRITSDLTTNVSKTITKKIQEINQTDSGVMVITHKSLANIPFFQDKNEWTCVIDEIPSVESWHEMQFPYSHDSLTKYVEIDCEIPPHLYKLKLVNKKEALKFVDLEHDAQHATYKQLIIDLCEEHDVFVDKTQWDKIVIKNEVTPDAEVDLTFGNQQNTLYGLTMQNARICAGFKECIVMGSQFEESLLYAWWSEHKNINFAPFAPIQDNLRYTQYENGSRLTIKYIMEGNHSKYKRDKDIMVGDKSMKFHEHCNEIATKEFNNEQFLAVANNDIVDESMPINSIRMPVICHGMNCYQHLHNIYFGVALNYKPWQLRMLEALGWSRDFLIRAHAHEVAHQCIMRTSMRDPNATEPVKVVVADKATAEAIARLFPGCKIGPVDGVLKQTIRDHASYVVNKTRDKKRELLKSLYEVVENNRETEFTGSFFGHTKSTSAEEFDFTTREFIKCLTDIYNSSYIDNKDEEFLMNGVKFNGVSRKKEDVIYASPVVILDIDEGDLTREEFTRIFTEDHKMSHILCNSFSRCATQPNRYRAFFFLDSKVTSEIYTIIAKHLCGIVAKYGYVTCPKQQQAALLAAKPDTKFSGIDWGKMGTSNMFYPPCHNNNELEYAFFDKHLCEKTRELERYSIRVESIIKFSKDTTRLSPLKFVDEVKVETNNVVDHSVTKDRAIFNKCVQFTKEMYSGNYGYEACKIGGYAQYIEDYKLKSELAELVWGALSNSSSRQSHFNSFKQYAKI